MSGIYDARKAKKDENDAIEAAYRERGMFELIKRNNPDVTGADLVDIGRKSYEAQSANASKASTSGQSTNSQQAADAQQQAQQAEQKANQALQALKRGDSKPKPRDASAKRSTGSRLNRLMDMLTAFSRGNLQEAYLVAEIISTMYTFLAGLKHSSPLGSGTEQEENRLCLHLSVHP